MLKVGSCGRLGNEKSPNPINSEKIPSGSSPHPDKYATEEEMKALKDILNRSAKKEHRPWGYFKTLQEDSNGKYKIKLIHVTPEHRLSLQKHKYRDEYWHILSGTGVLTTGNYLRSIKPGSQAVIPAGTLHRVQCSSIEPLEILELQTGERLEEDDIERLQDDYGRR